MPQQQSTILKTTGFWLALLIGIFQAINVVRCFSDPIAFAFYMGLPISGADSVGFVYVYGLRTAFIALLVFMLLALERLDALSWVALAALLMPIGDAILAAKMGARTATVARHAVIAIYLLVAFSYLRRAVSAGIGKRS